MKKGYVLGNVFVRHSLIIAFFGLLFLSCSGQTTEPEKVWTSEDCADHVHNNESWSFDECDSVLYRDFINDCQWEGDTIPSEINDFANVGAQMRPFFWDIKKLSPKMVRIWWWVAPTFRGTMTDLPPEIWELPRAYMVILNGMHNLKKIPDMTKTNETITYIGIANMSRLDSLPSGLWNAPNLTDLDMAYLGILHLPDWLPKLKSLKMLRIVNSQLVDFPENIVEVPKLAEFVFNDNQITTLPGSFCHDGGVSISFMAQHNHICNLPDSIKACTNWGTDTTQICQ